MNNDFMTQLSLELSNLYMAGYEKGFNTKTLEIAKVYKESNNPVLRQEGTNTYLMALKLAKDYEDKAERIVTRIKELLFSIQEEE